MQKKKRIPSLAYFSMIMLLGLIMTFMLCGFLFPAKAKKTTIIFTGGLGELFHPMGQDPDQQKDILGLERILKKLKKSYPDALFVDTGNFVDIPDKMETIYGTPAMVLLRKYGLDAANLGTKELTLGERLKIYRYASREKPPFFVSILEDAEKKKSLVNPFIDLKNGNKQALRITGTTSIDHRFSSPLLEKKIKALNQSRTIEGIIGQSSIPDATVLLSDLKPSDNDRLAANIDGLNIILESGSAPGRPVRKNDKTYICRRTEKKSVGMVTFRINKKGEIDKVKCESFPIRKKGGPFSLFKKKKDEPVQPPLPRLGIMVPKKDLFERLSVSYEDYEIRRIHAREFSRQLKNSHVYFYELYKNDQITGRTFYVDHALGKGRPTYMFFVTLDPSARIKEVDFILIPLIAGINPRLREFLEQYFGKKWDEMGFDPRGCGGAVEEFKILFRDIQLASRIVDTLSE